MITQDTLLSDRYRLERPLARGGMADVYEGLDLVLQRPVAVKVLRTAGDPDSQRFIDEMLASSQLTHPHVVRLFDAGEHDGALFLVLELVRGRSLREEIRQRGALPGPAVARVGHSVALALGHAHGAKIMHRDVKPANILLGDDGIVRLADFGIARMADATRATMTGHTLGTAGYLAPEQVAGEPVGPPVDVYALGLVLLEALSGRKEYSGSPVEAALARLHRPPLVPESLGEGWRDLLAALTARRPEDRPDADEAARLLARAGAAPGSPPTPPAEPARQRRLQPAFPSPPIDRPAGAAGSPPHPPARRIRATRRWRALAWAAAAMVALLLVTLPFLTRHAPRDEPFPPSTAVAPPGHEPSTLPPDVDAALQRLERAVER